MNQSSSHRVKKPYKALFRHIGGLGAKRRGGTPPEQMLHLIESPIGELRIKLELKLKFQLVINFWFYALILIKEYLVKPTL